MNLNFPKNRLDLLIISGEHSGDEHGGELVRELLQQRPGLKIGAIGGECLENAGAHLIYNMTQSSVVGFWEVLKKYRFFKKIFNQLLDFIEVGRPKAVLFIDYPGFNLRFAKALFDKKLSEKAGGSIPLYYYISPQIWAWKSKRRFQMATHLNGLAVLFPFEKQCYADTDLPVEFVGHPFLRESYHSPIEYAADGPILLLPGSRKAPVEKIFPKMIEALENDPAAFKDKRFAVIYPSAEIREVLVCILNHYPRIKDRFDLILQDRHSPVKASAALMSSGTVSLIAALAGMPGVLMYVASPITYCIGRLFVKIKYLGMASLLLNREVYPEFIQHASTPTALSKALQKALLPESREQAMQAASDLRHQLGSDMHPYPHPTNWLIEHL